MRRGHFYLPIGHSHLIPEDCLNADFCHIKQLYQKEEAKTLKIGHKLKIAALNPSNLQKTSPQLALCKLQLVYYALV